MPIYVDRNEIVLKLVADVEEANTKLREKSIAKVRACITLCQLNLQKSTQNLEQVSEEVAVEAGANPFRQLLFKFLSIVTPNAYTQQLQQLELASQALEQGDFNAVDYILFHFKEFAARNLNGSAEDTVSAVAEILPALDYLIKNPSYTQVEVYDQRAGQVQLHSQAHEVKWPQNEN